MADRPFLCSKCGNWYTPIPVAPDDGCLLCVMGTHATNKAGIYDCHFGHQAATRSEVKMATLLSLCQEAAKQAKAVAEGIPNAQSQEWIRSSMTRVEQAFAKAELGQTELPEILRWAGVMELPGRQDDDRRARFKDMAGIEDLVADNRRPPEDLETLRRSVRICNEMATELPGLLSDARMSLIQARQAAGQWTTAPPVRSAAADRMAKARAAKRAKQAVAA